MAILLAMFVADQMSLAAVKNRLSEVVDQVERERARVVVTKHGRRAVVVMSVDDLESLEETLDVLSDQTLLRQLRKSMVDLAAGRTTVLSKDEALAVLRTQ
jgi:antitoxin YefM